MIKVCEYCKKEYKTDNRKQKCCSRTCARKNTYTPDNSIFENGLNNTNAYILGLIYSDGCLYYSNHTKRYRITLSSKDKELMDEIHLLMTPKKKLYKDNKNFQIVTSNEEDIKFVQNLGLMERKTKSLTFPKIEKEYLSHFIRGFFDGDGCVYKSKTYSNGIEYTYVYVSICCASYDFIKELSDILNDLGINNVINIDKRRKEPFYLLDIKRKDDSKKFRDFIYQDAEMYLDRKKNIFTSMI